MQNFDQIVTGLYALGWTIVVIVAVVTFIVESLCVPFWVYRIRKETILIREYLEIYIKSLDLQKKQIEK